MSRSDHEEAEQLYPYYDTSDVPGVHPPDDTCRSCDNVYPANLPGFGRGRGSTQSQGYQEVGRTSETAASEDNRRSGQDHGTSSRSTFRVGTWGRDIPDQDTLRPNEQNEGVSGQDVPAVDRHTSQATEFRQGVRGIGTAPVPIPQTFGSAWPESVHPDEVERDSEHYPSDDRTIGQNSGDRVGDHDHSYAVDVERHVTSTPLSRRMISYQITDRSVPNTDSLLTGTDSIPSIHHERSAQDRFSTISRHSSVDPNSATLPATAHQVSPVSSDAVLAEELEMEELQRLKDKIESQRSADSSRSGEISFREVHGEVSSAERNHLRRMARIQSKTALRNAVMASIEQSIGEYEVALESSFGGVDIRRLGSALRAVERGLRQFEDYTTEITSIHSEAGVPSNMMRSDVHSSNQYIGDMRQWVADSKSVYKTKKREMGRDDNSSMVSSVTATTTTTREPSPLREVRKSLEKILPSLTESSGSDASSVVPQYPPDYNFATANGNNGSVVVNTITQTQTMTEQMQNPPSVPHCSNNPPSHPYALRSGGAPQVMQQPITDSTRRDLPPVVQEITPVTPASTNSDRNDPDTRKTREDTLPRRNRNSRDRTPSRRRESLSPRRNRTSPRHRRDNSRSRRRRDSSSPRRGRDKREIESGGFLEHMNSKTFAGRSPVPISDQESRERRAYRSTRRSLSSTPPRRNDSPRRGRADKDGPRNRGENPNRRDGSPNPRRRNSHSPRRRNSASPRRHGSYSPRRGDRRANSRGRDQPRGRDARAPENQQGVMMQMLQALTMPKVPDIQLPVFDGDVSKWESFIDIFDSTVHRYSMTDGMKLLYLKAQLKGEAARALARVSSSDGDYRRAREILIDRFSNRQDIVDRHAREMFDHPRIKFEEKEVLLNFMDLMKHHLHVLRKYGDQSIHAHALNINLMLTKLPDVTQQSWKKESQKLSSRDLRTTKEFFEFLTWTAKSVLIKSKSGATSSSAYVDVGDSSEPYAETSLAAASMGQQLGSYSSAPLPGEENSPQRERLLQRLPKHLHHWAAKYSELEVDQCSGCRSKHSRLEDCSEFLKCSVSDRWEVVKLISVCFKCLSKGHGRQECKSSNCAVSNCNRPHHALLHGESPGPRGNQNQGNFSKGYPPKGGGQFRKAPDKPPNQDGAPKDNSSGTTSAPAAPASAASNANAAGKAVSKAVNGAVGVASASVQEVQVYPTVTEFMELECFDNEMLNLTGETKNIASSGFHAPGQLPDENQVAVLPTLQVKLEDRLGQPFTVRCLLDTGSQGNFITHRLARRLGCKIVKTKIKVNTVSDGSFITSRGIAVIEFESTCKAVGWNNNLDQRVCLRIEAIILDVITKPTPAVILDDTCLPGDRVVLGDKTFHVPENVEVLLGVMMTNFMVLDGSSFYQDGIKFYSTRFGYVGSGLALAKMPRVMTDGTAGGKACSRAHFAGLRAVDYRGTGCMVSHVIDVSRFWETEDLPPPLDVKTLSQLKGAVAVKQPYTPEEQLAVDHYDQTHQKLKDGRTSVQLPWKPGSKVLGDSERQARKRFMNFEQNKMSKNDQIRMQYTEQFRELIKNEFMEEVPDEDMSKPHWQTFYIPHHAVHKMSSTTTKTRIVFDASMRSSNGVSLNENLLKGPTIQVGLFENLVRFRKHRYGLTGDITKMYQQVLLQDDAKEYHRIFWRENPEHPLKLYRMTRVTFGVTSSGYHAIRVLMDAAHATKCPRTRQAILEESYVDDFLTGDDTKEAVTLLRENLSESLAKHGYEIRKFCCSIPEVVAELPERLRENVSAFNIVDKEHAVKTLGMRWLPIDDQFTFSVEWISELDTLTKLTKRQLLSEISKLYDPLGIISPVTVTLKLIMQESWMHKIDWDKALPPEICEVFNCYRKSLVGLREVRMDRWVLADINPEIAELHVFCDASERAYAAAVYMRSGSGCDIKTMLVTAKTRVAPLKAHTIARLELCAMALGAKLVMLVEGMLKRAGVIITQCYGWTDSAVALCWVNGHSRQWTTFVANRVSEIHQCMPDQHWHHVGTHDNPADIATRGLDPSDLVNCGLWWYGPAFLRLLEFPTQPAYTQGDNENADKERKSGLICSLNPEDLLRVRVDENKVHRNVTPMHDLHLNLVRCCKCTNEKWGSARGASMALQRAAAESSASLPVQKLSEFTALSLMVIGGCGEECHNGHDKIPNNFGTWPPLPKTLGSPNGYPRNYGNRMPVQTIPIFHSVVAVNQGMGKYATKRMPEMQNCASGLTGSSSKHRSKTKHVEVEDTFLNLFDYSDLHALVDKLGLVIKFLFLRAKKAATKFPHLTGLTLFGGNSKKALIDIPEGSDSKQPYQALGLQFLIRREQAKFFGVEMKVLWWNKSHTKTSNDPDVRLIASKSRLIRLYPFVDVEPDAICNDKILKVGGRLANARGIPDEQKYPAILPPESRLSDLIISAAHEGSFHGGVQTTMAQVRSEYWIISLQQKVRQWVKNCVICARMNTRVMQQLQGDLPVNRVSQAPPFSYVGIDFTGHIYVRSDRTETPIDVMDAGRNIPPGKHFEQLIDVAKVRASRRAADAHREARKVGKHLHTQKAYLAIFVCFATKAVHIETVARMDTGSCSAALRRFVARRGAPKRIFSDNGTNFVGTRTELMQLRDALIDQADPRAMKNIALNVGATWSMIPPAAPHFGGLWEAGVKQAKMHLRKVLGKNVVTMEELRTIATEIEAMLNTRPLCALSNEEGDLKAISAGQLLLGREHYFLPSRVPFSISGTMPPAMETSEDLRARWKRIEELTLTWWGRWTKEYLTTLQRRTANPIEKEDLHVGDLVLITDDQVKGVNWPLGRVIEVYPGADNRVRCARVKTEDGEMSRPIVKLRRLPLKD